MSLLFDANPLFQTHSFHLVEFPNSRGSCSYLYLVKYSCSFCISFAWFLHSTEPLILHWWTSWLLKLDGLGNFYPTCHRSILFFPIFFNVSVPEWFLQTYYIVPTLGWNYLLWLSSRHVVCPWPWALLSVSRWSVLQKIFPPSFTCGLDLWQLHIVLLVISFCCFFGCSSWW